MVRYPILASYVCYYIAITTNTATVAQVSYDKTGGGLVVDDIN